MSRIFFDILEVNIAISVIILVLYLLAEKLRNRYGASWMKLVWLLLAVRLMVPYNFSLPFTEIRLFNLPGFEQEESFFHDIAQVQEDIKDNSEPIEKSPVDTMQTIGNPSKEYDSVADHNQSVIFQNNTADSSNAENMTEASNAALTDVLAQTAEVSEIEAGKKTNFSYADIMTGIWMLGIVLGLLYLAFGYVRFCLKYNKDLEAVVDKDLEQALIAVQKKIMGKAIPVYQNRSISSPMLIGIFSPKLVVPILSRQWSATELEMIVAHEICHYKKKDLVLKLLMMVTCCINWFNPFIYMMKRQFFYDMELACDGNVLLECNVEEREVYARLLLIFAGKTKPASVFSTGFGERKKWMKKRNIAIYLSISSVCLSLSACGAKEHIVETPQQESVLESVSENTVKEKIETDNTTETNVPSKEEILAMRELVLEGMSDEEIERLTENIKVANLRLESAYLNDNIFDKLSNKDSFYWNYFDQKGEIQIGWAYDGSYSDMKAIMEDEGISQNEFYEKYGEPVMEYNRFDAANFINLIQDMQESVQNEMLIADLQQLIDLTSLAAETHEMEYANEIYKILHDLDYFLLRYGIEDVGKYTKDSNTVSKYYGVLIVYGETSVAK